MKVVDKIRNKLKISSKSVLLFLGCVVISVFTLNLVIQSFNDNLYAQSRRSGGNRRGKSARSGSVKRGKSARSGSTKRGKSARSGSTKRGKSARSGSTRRGRSARSGSLRGGRQGGSSDSAQPTGQFSSAPESKTEFLGFTGSRAGNASKSKEHASCIYAYVNCMDTLINRILNKNAFLGTDPAVKHLVLSDKPFRCVYAGAGNYDNYINDLLDNAKMQDTSFTFMINEHFGGTGNNAHEEQRSNNTGDAGNNRKFDASKWVFEKVKVYTKELTGKIKEEAERDIEDYWVTALYKKYNFFCQEKQNSNDKSCAYSGKGHSDYMATKESTAYYMDLSSRVRGGCSNAFNEYPSSGEDDGSVDEDTLRNAENECKISGGFWHKPNSLKMVDMSSDIMSDLGADSKGICVLQDSSGKNITEVGCKKYGAEAIWGNISDAMAGAEPVKGCMLSEATATSCKSIDQVYSSTGTGNLVSGRGNWIRRKEWVFVLNTAPPSMTLNPGEEFGWAHGICMTATSIEDVAKSKLKNAIKELVINKLSDSGKDEDDGSKYLQSLLAPKESAKGKSYLEILKGCGDIEGRLEKFYMTGEWKEYESDCEKLKGPKLVNKCKLAFELEEDCNQLTDEKKKKSCEKRKKQKADAKAKKKSKGVDCNRYMKNFTKEKKEWIEKADKDCSKEEASKQEACNKDKNSVLNNTDYQKFIKTAAYKGALSNKIKCEANNKSESGEETTRVEVDMTTGEKYISMNDSTFMTPAKSCLQYEDSLKATRNAWKAKAMEAIAENSRNIANQLKKEEAKQLAADLKVNMEIANMTNKVFSQCLGEMRSCMTKESLCGKDYKGCVDVNGLRKDKLLPAGIECYAPFKACMQTTSKTLNAKNMSPQLQEIVKGLEQDPNKVSAMAIDSIGESLGDTFDKLMEKECKNVGGFYTNGICGMGIFKASYYSASAWSSKSKTYTGYYQSGTDKNGYAKYSYGSMSSSSSSSSSYTEDKKKVGIMLPGSQVTCNSTQSSSNYAQSSYSSDPSNSSSSNYQGGSSYNSSETMLIITQKDDSVEIKSKEQSCGFMFSPKGPWDEFTKPCIGSENKFIFPDGRRDALTIATEKFSNPIQGSRINYSFKDFDGLRKYKLTVVDGPKISRRYYIEAYDENTDQNGNKRRVPKNMKSIPREFSMKEKEDGDWKLYWEEAMEATKLCKPRYWITDSEFKEVEKRWIGQFK